MITDQIECFLSLARFLNFSRAANSMYITQPAFSRHISNLEKELGMSFFYRDKRSVKLTAAGEAFLNEAKKMIINYNNGIVKAKQAEKGIIGSIKIGFLKDSINWFLPKLVRNFRSKYPEIDIRMNEYNHYRLTEAMYNDLVDVAFTTSVEISVITGINWEIVSRNYYCVVMHENHPLSSNDPIELEKLAKEPFILLDPVDAVQGHNQVMQICREHGFYPTITAKVGYITSLLIMVDCQMGISILPNIFNNLACPGVLFKRIKNSNHLVDIVVAWKKQPPNPCLPFFLEEMQKILPSK